MYLYHLYAQKPCITKHGTQDRGMINFCSDQPGQGFSYLSCPWWNVTANYG